MAEALCWAEEAALCNWTPGTVMLCSGESLCCFAGLDSTARITFCVSEDEQLGEPHLSVRDLLGMWQETAMYNGNWKGSLACSTNHKTLATSHCVFPTPACWEGGAHRRKQARAAMAKPAGKKQKPIPWQSLASWLLESLVSPQWRGVAMETTAKD